MVARQYAILFGILAATSLSGCSQTIGLYHDAEGGAIAQHRQPPPGADLPYPNLADVPAPTQQARSGASPAPAGLAASPAALAGLSLPTAPPPVPVISGLTVASGMAPAPAAPTPPPVARRAPAKTVMPPPGPPVSVAFNPGSALLSYNQQRVVEGVAAGRGDARLRVCGFGDGSLTLALARARRIADALTEAGVPGQEIDISAFAAGSGGFVQLVY